MILKLTLETKFDNSILPINYQYPLSAAIYKIIGRGNEAYAHFLHDIGYKQDVSLKAFKLFCFSDISTPFKIHNDRIRLLTRQAELKICFHLPKAAEHFIKGLFFSQTIEIADRKSRGVFSVARAEVIPTVLTHDHVQELLLRPLSPVVCGLKDGRGNYSFLAPEHPDFPVSILYNWKAKYGALYGSTKSNEVFENTEVKLALSPKPPRSRLITIKDGTPQATKIRGYVNFRLKVRSRKDALELLLNSGVGVYNAQGMGCVVGSSIS